MGACPMGQLDEPMRLEEQLAMDGVGWEGDLDAMRTDRFGEWSGDTERVD